MYPQSGSGPDLGIWLLEGRVIRKKKWHPRHSDNQADSTRVCVCVLGVGKWDTHTLEKMPNRKQKVVWRNYSPDLMSFLRAVESHLWSTGFSSLWNVCPNATIKYIICFLCLPVVKLQSHNHNIEPNQVLPLSFGRLKWCGVKLVLIDLFMAINFLDGNRFGGCCGEISQKWSGTTQESWNRSTYW